MHCWSIQWPNIIKCIINMNKCLSGFLLICSGFKIMGVSGRKILFSRMCQKYDRTAQTFDAPRMIASCNLCQPWLKKKKLTIGRFSVVGLFFRCPLIERLNYQLLISIDLNWKIFIIFSRMKIPRQRDTNKEIMSIVHILMNKHAPIIKGRPIVDIF